MAIEPHLAVANKRQRSPIRLAFLLVAIFLLGFSALVWTTLKLKVHLHVPLVAKNNQRQTFDIIYNQSCFDLIGFAQDHDKAGEFDFATSDYKAGVASPSFKTMPPKIKAVMIELADCRDSMDRSDYFDEMVVHSRIGYWKQEQMPLRIYIPDETHKDGFGKFDREEIERCYQQWCSVIPERLSFKIVDDPEQADISFSQKEHAVDLSFSRFVLAHTIPLPAGPERWAVFPAGKARVEPLRLIPEILNKSDKRAALRHTVFMHEIGHTLGLIGHSSNAADLMYFSGTSELSDRDKNTLKRIYAPGSIYERSEKSLRQRAAANDKYAVVQLAQQLDANGTSSPGQSKEIFELTKKAALMGSSKAKLALGWMYHDGIGVKRDLQIASKYLHDSCQEGEPAALLALEAIYERGDGVAQDLSAAEKYLRLALRVDAPRAPLVYGNLLSYFYGDNASQIQAATFYKNGCKTEQVESMIRLALLYEHGEGVPKDEQEAASLKSRARAQIARLQARDASEYFARACMWATINETEKALADYSEAIKLKSDFRAGYLARAASYQAVGQNEQACADLTKALELDPLCVQAYLGRAYSNLGLGRAASALKDANSVLACSVDPDSDRVYAMIIGSLASRQLHDETDANRLLGQATANCVSESWPTPIIKFLSHKMSESEFEAQALGYSRSTEVHFYLAMEQSLSGKSQDAIKNFQWVKDNGDRTFYEYPVAMAQLERLQKPH